MGNININDNDIPTGIKSSFLSKKTFLIIIFLIIIIIIGCYFYKNNTINSAKDKIVDPINYTFSTKVNFDYKDEVEDMSINMNIKDASFITKNQWLQQRVSIDEFSIKGWIQDLEFKNFDLVSNNDKYYIKWDFNIDKDFSKDEVINKVINILNKWKYVKVDNSKAIFNILWDFWKNELIRELVIWAVTSNPDAYYKNNKTLEKLSKELKTDKIINFIFKEWTYDKATKKTNLLLNEKICSLTPIINNINKEFSNNDILSKEECIKSLLKANSLLWFVNLYKIWDTTKGDYKFIINQGSLFELQLGYKKHILNQRNISIVAPNNIFTLKISWNDKKITSSLLKININENWILINWEIKDWNWKITLKTSELLSDFADINGKLELKWYNLEEYDISILLKKEKLNFIAKWNKDKWAIIYTVWENKLDFNYENNIYNLFLNIDWIEITSKLTNESLDFDFKQKTYSWKEIITIKSTLNDKKFDFYLIEKNSSWEKIWEIEFKSNYSNILNADYTFFIESTDMKIKSEWNLFKKYLSIDFEEENYKSDFEYNKWKITANYFINDIKIIELIWNFKNIWDFDLNLNFIKEEWIITISAEKEENIYKYNFKISEKWDDILSEWYLNITLANWKVIINWTINIGSRITWSYDIESSLNIIHEYSNKKSTYKIPTVFEEVDIKLIHITNLPNLEKSLNFMNSNYSSIMILAWFSTVSFLSLSTVDKMNSSISRARDTQRINHIRILETVLQSYYSDFSEYPENLNEEDILTYIKNSTLPKDSYYGKTINWCKFWYYYEVWEDDWLTNNSYRLSTCVEDNLRSNYIWNKYAVWNLNNDFVAKKEWYIND